MTNSLQAQSSCDHHCVPVLDSGGSVSGSSNQTNSLAHAHITNSLSNGSSVTFNMNTNQRDLTRMNNDHIAIDEPHNLDNDQVNNFHFGAKAVHTLFEQSNQVNNSQSSSVNSFTLDAHQLAMQHIDEAIEQAIQKSVMYADGILELDSNNADDLQSYLNTTGQSSIKLKSKKKSKKKSKVNRFVDDEPKKKIKSMQSEQDRKRNALGPYVAVERLVNPSGGPKLIQYKVINQSQRADEKDVPRSRVRNELPKSVFVSKPTVVDSNSNQSDSGNWLCSFCHLPPHYRGLGDLFGPYLFNLNHSSVELNDENNSIEIWMHEDCVVWSNGTHFDGTRIRNVHQAYQDCFNVTCTKCCKNGASLRCLQKNCTSFYHFLCAKDAQAQFVNDHFSIFCLQHKKSDLSLEPV